MKKWLFTRELKLLTLKCLVHDYLNKQIINLDPLLLECLEEIEIQLAKIKGENKK